jgi:hypothetical protein
MGLRRSWVALLIGSIALVWGAAILAGCGDGGAQSGEAAAEADAEALGPFAKYNGLREAAHEGIEAHKASFERDQGGEASRESAASTPASEQVANRAFPRNYVDDRLARRESKTYAAIPAAKAGGAAWKALGPFTPNVTGADSQFFDPETLTGPPTQESGRVTALAIDPACTNGDCRLWVAAAGGGIWRTNNALAAQPHWIAPPNSLPTTAFGSIYYDAPNDVLYAGSGEPNGSGDSEAGLGLFKSTDGGGSWSVVPGSQSVATNRSIGAIAVNSAGDIFIGTDVARHGSSAANGGRRTPPDAPELGVYRSTNDGASFQLEKDLSDATPANPTPASTGADWFQGGVNKLEFDPNNPDQLYAAVQGYGIWRADQSDNSPTWRQVFHTMNQTNFSDPDNPGDFFGDRTEFDLVDLGTDTRIYVGDASDDWAIDGDDDTPLPQAWRNDAVQAVTGDISGGLDNAAAGYIQLSSDDPTKNGFAAYGYCQNGQCGYDSFVAHPPGAGAGTVWYGGSMNYDELKVYDQFGTGAPPRSNGRAVIRSTNAGGASPDTTATWGDMTAVLDNPADDWDVKEGIHPDLHAIAFANNGQMAFVGSDGGVVRIDVSGTQNQSASCPQRKWNYDAEDPVAAPVPLMPEDLALCNQLLSAVPISVKPVNDGLDTIQFQSLSVNPKHATSELQGGTQDNGTWSYKSSRTAAKRWFESVGGDGGQSGFDRKTPSTRYHNYYDATPEVNFHGSNTNTWLNIYDPLQESAEARSFYTPFIADPRVAGRAFTGMESVWRTDVSASDEQGLIDNGCLAYALDPFREAPCGDWRQLGGNLTTSAFKPSRAGQYVVAVERAPSDTGTLWAATRTGRVFITQNADDTPGSVSFRRIDRSNTPTRFISGISIDPENPLHAWISYSGYDAYTPDTPGHVFEARYHPATHRATYKDLSFNLGDQPVTGIARHGSTGDLYAATDFGVLRLKDGGHSWTKAAPHLPNVAVYAITIAQKARTLYAATHGRGAYSLKLK